MTGRRVLDLVLDDEWRDRAACLGVEDDRFFPEPGKVHVAESALEICRTCPVQSECLTHAVRHRIDHGIWGGLDAKQRRRFVRLAKKAKAL